MSIQEYLAHMKEVYEKILDFLENEASSNSDIREIIKIIKDHQIPENRHYFKSLLYLLIHISNNHHRGPNFLDAIFQILKTFKQNIQNYFSNSEIFHIFHSNKRLLLFLIDGKIITIDTGIAHELSNKKFKDSQYPQYFFTDLQNFIQIFQKTKCKPLEEKVKIHRNQEEPNPEDISWINNMQNDLPSNFDQNRHKGENDSYICQLIRKDSLDDFIVYINQKNISYQSTIEISIYETNPFLIQMKNTTLIEYAFFYGSTSIINYLKMSGVKLTPSLWIYSIHSQDPNVFQILEENNVPFPDEDYFILLKESIKCHHNDFANYFMENYYQEDEIKSKKIIQKSLKYYNFEFLNENKIDDSLFKVSILCDNYLFVEFLFKNEYINNKYKCIAFQTKLAYYMGKYYDSKTPLYIATEKGYIDLMKFFLKQENIDINDYSEIFTKCTDYRIKQMFFTAFHCAVFNGNLEAVKILLSHEKIDPNKYDMLYGSSKKRTPIYYAVNNENIEMIKLLLESYKVDPNIENRCNNPVLLNNAVNKENIEIVKLLLSCEKVDVNKTNQSNKWKLFKQKLFTEETALFLAILRKNVEIVNLLLSCESIDVNLPINRYDYIGGDLVQELSILDLAIYKKNIEIIKSLISCERIDVNFLSKSLDDREKNVQKRKKNNKKDEEEEIEEEKYLSVEHNTAPLTNAIQRNNVTIVKLFLDSQRFDVNILSVVIWTCIDRFPTKYTKHETITETEISPLRAAIEIGNAEIVRLLLLCKDIDVNFMLNTYHSKITKIENPWDCEIKNKNEYEQNTTPLHLAVKSENVKIINMLLQHKNIDVQIIDYKKKKASDYASNEKIKELFNH